MKIQGVPRILLGVASLCWLPMSMGCNGALPTDNSQNPSGPSGGAPIASVNAPGDWGASMLAGGTVGAGMFPAHFTFDVNAPPSCASDFVAFNTSLAGVSPTTAASRGGNTFAAAGTPAGTLTIRHGATSLVLTAAGNNTGNNFLVVVNTGAGNTVNATSLAAKIASLGGPIGVTATPAAATVTITALNKGLEGNSIALASTLTNFALGGAALTGGLGTGNIVAFNQLYSTQGSVGGLCNQNGPSVYWSYFTGTGTAVTSVVLSGDGSKVAFVENVGGTATLRILKWKAGEGVGTGYPVAPTTTLATATTWAAGCPVTSCLRSIAFSGGAATDTRSAPFYNYGTDTLYVGDNAGIIHKFTPVFNNNGAPAEVTISWPITVHAGFILTSPLYDSVSGNIFVGDSGGRLSFIQEVGSTVGGATPCSPKPCLNTVNLAVGTGGAIVDSPVVDGTTGRVIAVNGTDTLNNGTILQASTGLTGAVSFKIGGNLNPGSPIYSGAFDNTYLNSAIPNIAGHMYVCGKDSGFNDRPYVYQLSFAAATGILTGVGTGRFPAGNGFVSASQHACSPVTEFFNPNGGGLGIARDWIFFSVGNRANNAATNNPIPAGACRTNNAGCVLSINVTGNPTWPLTLPTALIVAAPVPASVPANNGSSTSGMVVDNTSTSAQASSFYFSLATNSTGAGPGVPSCNTTAGVGCAVKLTQSGLN
jgi:hypothetical protein